MFCFVAGCKSKAVVVRKLASPDTCLRLQILQERYSADRVSQSLFSLDGLVEGNNDAIDILSILAVEPEIGCLSMSGTTLAASHLS